MFPYWEQSTNSLASCRFSRHSTVSALRLIECLSCWRRGWDSARSLRELPANLQLCCSVGRTGFESPYLTRRENKKAPRGAVSFSGGGASPLRRMLSGILPRLSPESSPECDVTIYANRESIRYQIITAEDDTLRKHLIPIVL